MVSREMIVSRSNDKWNWQKKNGCLRIRWWAFPGIFAAHWHL
jgi:hypothetical protein